MCWDVSRSVHECACFICGSQVLLARNRVPCDSVKYLHMTLMHGCTWNPRHRDISLPVHLYTGTHRHVHTDALKLIVVEKYTTTSVHSHTQRTHHHTNKHTHIYKYAHKAVRVYTCTMYDTGSTCWLCFCRTHAKLKCKKFE